MLEQAKIILTKTGVDKLPSLPHVLLKLLFAINTEHNNFDLIARYIRTDPALYTRFFYIKNLSAHKNQSYQTLEKLLPYIGADSIKNIINTSSVQQFFSPYSLEKVEFLKQHWQHSVLCAELSRLLAEKTHYKNTDDAYTAGLLHDIGQLSLESAHPKQYTSTFAQLSENEFFHELENDAFNTTHQHMSTCLLQDCHLNHEIIDAVLYHHEHSSLILDAHPLVKIVNLANQLSSSEFNSDDNYIFEIAESLFSIDKTEMLTLLDNAKNFVNKISSELDMNFKADDADGETANQVDGDNELKQVQLAEQVRNIALFESAQQNTARNTSKADAVKNIELQAGLLFSVSNVIVFEYDEANNQVSALSSNSEPVLFDNLSIPLQAHRSLVTDAIISQTIKHSFELDTSNQSVIDQQLAGLNDSEGLLCIPMQIKNTATGVLVFGVSKEQQILLCKQSGLLSRFANTITQSLNVNTETETNTSEEIESLVTSNRKIAHEIRNPLSVINNYLEILSYKLSTDSDSNADSSQEIATIKSEIERIGGILEKLSTPAAPATISQNIDINLALTELSQIFLNSLAADKSINIKLDLDEAMPHIECNIDVIKQIYTNLVKNAIEALPTNGQILVYTCCNVNVNGQEFIEISVSDNGPGIAESILPGLFSPVESTKGEDHSGLGLTIVNDLVSDLNGTISCKSSNRGTSFHILLPKIL